MRLAGSNPATPIMEILLTILLTVVPSYFLWTILHEVSHFLMYASFRKILRSSFKLYPHVVPGKGFVWASVEVEYKGVLNSTEEIAVSLAPRILGFLALCLLPLASLFPFVWLQVGWVVFWGAGLVDFVVGSIGSSEESDLKKASKELGWNPWVLRILGWSLAIISATILVVAFVL